MNNKYLLEIGTEELPAKEVKQALVQLKNNAKKLLAEERINYETIQVYSTPRRLALIIDGIAEKQDSIEEELKGPSKKIAYKDGEPTKALLGFMKGKGLSEDDISLKLVNDEEYVFANYTLEGKETKEVLKDIMPKLVRSISFNKTMRWGGKNLRFARPIRWLVSIFNSEVIEFNLEDIKIGNQTKGHRFLGGDKILIDHVDNYENILKENYCILNQKQRKEHIEIEANRLAREKGGKLLAEESLIEEVANIVEYPTLAVGDIDEDYLKLPIEVVVTPMKEQLKFFPVGDDEGNLLPYFITVRNGDSKHIENVVKGNEKVLGARLEDAKFFYYADIERPLESYVEELKDVTFQDGLGTMYDKVTRISKLGEKISEYLEVGDETKSNFKRAAYLSKADLVTQMVDEFTELQGRMGMEYALQSNENEIVSIAISEQYLPNFSGDSLPTTTAGSILSIADKLDTITGMFAVGIKPTSSQDPYGLRRQALGVINIILEKRLTLKLSSLVDSALYLYVEENGLVFNYEEVKLEIIEFFRIRLRNMLIEKGYSYDLVDAVIAINIDDIYDICLRVEKLSDYFSEEGSKDILETFNRVINISGKAIGIEVDTDLFEQEEEANLYNKFKNIEEDFQDSLDNRYYGESLDILASLKKPVDDFFDNVMVMVENEDVKNNRLNLLNSLSVKMLKVCDLSKLEK